MLAGSLNRMIDASRNEFPLLRPVKIIGTFVSNVLRWFVYEFLPISVRNTLSSRVIDFCRLLAFATMVSLMLFETRDFALQGLRTGWPVWVLDGLLAILVGNIVKECAIWISARIVNSLGLNFHRRGVMLNGKWFSEVVRSDGTWRRCEFGDRETTCEWTDRFGAASRSVSRARLHGADALAPRPRPQPRGRKASSRLRR